MSTSSEKRYGGLDGFRLIAAILVIANHTSPLWSYDVLGDFILTRIISRVTVPFFFMCTGYFFLQKIGTDKRRNLELLKNFLMKIGKLYLFSILLYIPVNIYTGYFTDSFSVVVLVKDILFKGTLYHLWYFPGVMLGVCICYFLYTRLSLQRVFAISLLLYVVGLFGDSYYAFSQLSPPIESIYEAIFMLFDSTRNGLFFALVFITLGGMIALSGKPKQGKIMWHTIGFLFFFGMMVAEGLLVYLFQLARHDSMYMLTIPSMYFLFQLLLSYKMKSNRYLRDLGMYVYILHPMCIIIVRAVGKVADLTPLIVGNSLLHFLLVTVLSFVIAIAMMGVVNKVKKERVLLK